MSLISESLKWAGAGLQYFRKDVSCKILPVRVWLEPTNHCNLKCVMCPNKDIDECQKGFMELGLFYKIVDELSSITKSVNLYLGGEPLVHPQIIDMVKYLKGKDMFVRIHTNATLLTEKMSKELIESGLDFISFSFDGYNPKAYEKIRVNASFENTLNNIIRFLEIKDEIGHDMPFTTFQVIELPDVTEESIKEKKKLLDRLKDLPVDDYRIEVPCRFAGKIPEEITGTRYAFTRDDGLKYRPCWFPWVSMHILWDGRVVPCCVDFMGEYALGDASSESLLDVWNGEKMIKLRKKLKDNDIEDINPCSNCDMLYQREYILFSKRHFQDFKRLVKEGLHSIFKKS